MISLDFSLALLADMHVRDALLDGRRPRVVLLVLGFDDVAQEVGPRRGRGQAVGGRRRRHVRLPVARRRSLLKAIGYTLKLCLY